VFAARYPLVPHPASAEDFMVILGHTPERMLIPQLDDYPAHLHIDLLPEVQGLGLGRRLIETLRASLAARGIRGVHLVMDSANTPARAFYDRIGFVELPTDDESVAVLGIRTA
jgi:ribosomal protein S18 acetylase RimI-like enzyme